MSHDSLKSRFSTVYRCNQCNHPLCCCKAEAHVDVLNTLELPVLRFTPGRNTSLLPCSHPSQATIEFFIKDCSPNLFMTQALKQLAHLHQKTTLSPLTLSHSIRPFHTNTNMPLVVPGLMSSSSNKTEEWTDKLMGKKIGSSHDEVTFAKTDLPEEHRVVKQGDMVTMDHKPDR
jgi:hypothetical protein